MRALLRWLGLLVAALATVVLLAVMWNNRPADAPEPERLLAARDAAVAWIEGRDIANTDPMLWWMIKEAARLSGDERLRALYDDFRRNVFDEDYWLWLELFDEPRARPLFFEPLKGLPPYNLLLIYGFTCAEDLLNRAIVQRQMQADFCPSRQRFAPACRTHQLMGVLFMEQYGCWNAQRVAELKQALLPGVERQLTWDFRVVDVYLQRLLVLALAREFPRIEPVWVQRMLAAQRADGSWSNNRALLPLGGTRHLAFTRAGIGVQPVKGSFHTTAQAVLLTTLLLEQMTPAGAAPRSSD